MRGKEAERGTRDDDGADDDNADDSDDDDADDPTDDDDDATDDVDDSQLDVDDANWSLLQLLVGLEVATQMVFSSDRDVTLVSTDKWCGFLRYMARNDNDWIREPTGICGKMAASHMGRHGLFTSLVPKSIRRNDGTDTHRNRSCSRLYSPLPLWMDMRAHKLVKLRNPPPLVLRSNGFVLASGECAVDRKVVAVVVALPPVVGRWHRNAMIATVATVRPSQLVAH